MFRKMRRSDREVSEDVAIKYSKGLEYITKSKNLTNVYKFDIEHISGKVRYEKGV